MELQYQSHVLPLPALALLFSLQFWQTRFTTGNPMQLMTKPAPESVSVPARTSLPGNSLSRSRRVQLTPGTADKNRPVIRKNCGSITRLFSPIPRWCVYTSTNRANPLFPRRA